MTTTRGTETRNTHPRPGQHAWAARALVLLAGFAAAALASCASGYQSPPPGGPPDTTAPVVETMLPASGTVSFRERTVSFTFSEYMNESNTAASVVITPIPKVTPEFDWSGSTLEISFAEPLAENRTYAVTLGSALTDLSGNRLGRPVTVRFATGPTIDSGRIQGRVLGKAAGKAYVFAYLMPPDTAGFNATFRPDSVRPEFIAPIGDDGGFSLEGLPNGTFRLFAVVDDANDQLFTPGADAFGIPVHDAVVRSATEPALGVAIRLRPAADDQSAPALYSTRAISPTHTLLRFSEPIAERTIAPARFALRAPGATIAPTLAWRDQKQALAVHLVHPALPAGAEITVAATGLADTAGNALPDSAGLSTFTSVATPDADPPALVSAGLDSMAAYRFPDSLVVAFDEAVEVGNLTGAVTIRDTVSGGKRATFRLTRLSPAAFSARPIDTLFGLTQGWLAIELGPFADVAGNRRDSLVRVPVLLATPKQFGTIEGTLTDTAAPNANHVITARLLPNGPSYSLTGIRQGAWSFAAIPEGDYELSAFADTDGNGRYDYGSLIPYHPAEPYTLWSGNVKVRPRWTTNMVDLVIAR